MHASAGFSVSMRQCRPVRRPIPAGREYRRFIGRNPVWRAAPDAEVAGIGLQGSRGAGIQLMSGRYARAVGTGVESATTARIPSTHAPRAPARGGRWPARPARRRWPAHEPLDRPSAHRVGRLPHGGERRVDPRRQVDVVEADDPARPPARAARSSGRRAARRWRSGRCSRRSRCSGRSSPAAWPPRRRPRRGCLHRRRTAPRPRRRRAPRRARPPGDRRRRRSMRGAVMWPIRRWPSSSR